MVILAVVIVAGVFAVFHAVVVVVGIDFVNVGIFIIILFL